MESEFQAFHPFLTYKNEGGYFVDPQGRPSFADWPSASHPTNMSSDAVDLWRLGKRAFESLGEIDSKNKFDELYEYYLGLIRGLKFVITEDSITSSDETLEINQENDEKIPDLDQLSNTALVELAWRVTRQSPDRGNRFDFMREMFLFACLEEIDVTIIALCLDGRKYVISGSLAAAQAYGNFQAIESGNDNLQRVRSEFAARAAIERYKRDPKQSAKAFVKDCWDDWQKEPSRYKTQSAFASDVLTKVQTDENEDPIISFDTVIKKWIPKWQKAKK